MPRISEPTGARARRAHGERGVKVGAVTRFAHRWRSRLLLSAVVVASALAGTAVARASDPLCGQSITESVVLAADLNCTGNGLVIAGQNVTVDLNGHTIVGSGVGAGIRIGRGASGATVKNGTILGFAGGVLLPGFGPPGLDTPRNLTVERMTISMNQVGISVNESGVIRIEDSVITHNAGLGIELQTDTDDVWVLRNTIAHNGGGGVAANFSIDRALYQDNFVSHNGGTGIFVFSGTSQIIGNTVKGNGGDGIRLIESQPALLFRYLVSDNRADDNANWGIAQTAGMPDPMSNRAKHNGQPDQCLNITCTPV